MALLELRRRRGCRRGRRHLARPYPPPAYYAGPPPVAYACHYVRVRDYDVYGNPIFVRQRVCD
jgi:hypothetical protein